MALLIEFEGKSPTIGQGVFLVPTAVLVGDVRVGDEANIWFGAVLRGDFSHIEIGAGSSIQDNVVIHSNAAGSPPLRSRPGCPHPKRNRLMAPHAAGRRWPPAPTRT